MAIFISLLGHSDFLRVSHTKTAERFLGRTRKQLLKSIAVTMVHSEKCHTDQTCRGLVSGIVPADQHNLTRESVSIASVDIHHPRRAHLDICDESLKVVIFMSHIELVTLHG